MSDSYSEATQGPPDENHGQVLKDAGFPDSAVSDWKATTAATLMKAGFPSKAAYGYVGMPQFNPNGVQDMAQKNLQGGPQAEGDQTQPKTFQDTMDQALGMPASELVTGTNGKPLPAPMRAQMMAAYRNGTATTPGDFVSSSTPYISGIANNALLSLTTSLKTNPELIYAQATGNKALEQSALSDINAANYAREQSNPDIHGTTGKLAYNAATTVAGALPALAAATLNPLLGAASFVGQSGTEEYGQATAKGATPLSAGTAGAVAGAVNLLPLGPFAKVLGATGMKQFLTHAVALSGANVAASEISSATDKALIDPNKTWGQWLLEQPDAIRQAVVTGFAFAGVGGATHLAGRTDPAMENLKKTLAPKMGLSPDTGVDDFTSALHVHLGEKLNEEHPSKESFDTVASYTFGQEHTEQGADILMKVYEETGKPPVEVAMDAEQHPEIKEQLEQGQVPDAYAHLKEVEEEKPSEPAKPEAEAPLDAKEIADTHEADVEHTPPEQAAEMRDTVAQEFDHIVETDPEVHNAITSAIETARLADRGTDLERPAEAAEPAGAENVVPAQPSPERASRGRSRRKGRTVRATTGAAEPAGRNANAPDIGSLTPEHAQLEEKFGVPEDKNLSQLGKIEAKLGRIFSGKEEGFSPTHEMTDEGFQALEDYGRRVEESQERVVSENKQTGAIRFGKGIGERIAEEREARDNSPEDSVKAAEEARVHLPALLDRIKDSDLIYQATLWTNPDSASSDRARAGGLDVAGAMNWSRWHGLYQFDTLTKSFPAEQLKQMWNAREETSLFMRRLENEVMRKFEEQIGSQKDVSPKDISKLRKAAQAEARREAQAQAQKNKIGVFSDELSEGQKTVLNGLHQWAEEVKAKLIANKMLKSDIPFWTPRVGAMMDEEGNWRRMNLSERAPQTGAGFSRTSSHLMNRGYEDVADTDEALKALAEDYGIKDAGVVRDIRTLPLALAKLETALAVRKFVDQIVEVSKETGSAYTDGRPQWEGTFQSLHPALSKLEPKDWVKEKTGTLVEGEDGSYRPLTDENGDVIMKSVPLNIPREYEGTLMALLQHRDPSIYRGIMKLKNISMTNIMFSPFIHRQVIFGKAFALHPIGMLTGKVVRDGEAGLRDLDFMKRMITGGMVPISGRGVGQDVVGVMQGDRNLVPGASPLSRVAGKAVATVSPQAGEAVSRAVDAAGNKLHKEWLWDHILKIQVGLARHESDYYASQGHPQPVADRMAAKSANVFAGVIPKESMNEWARRLTDVLAFSRSYTLTNFGIVKAVAGLPGDVKAWIRHNYGAEEAQSANSVFRKKSFQVWMRDLGLYYAGAAVAQNFVNSAYTMYSDWKNHPEMSFMQDLDDAARTEMLGYMRRMKDVAEDVKQSPYSFWNIPAEAFKLSPLSENELLKKGRVFIGADEQGTRYYVKLPFGKTGEDMINFARHPFKTAGEKLAPQIKAVTDIAYNEDYQNRHIYNPNPESPGDYIGVAGDVVAHFMKSFVPYEDMQSLGKIMTGNATGLDYAKVAGGVTGFTVSKGYPGGLFAEKIHNQDEKLKYLQELAKPDVKAAALAGDDGRARELLSAAGVKKPREQNYIIEYYRNPQRVVNRRSLSVYYQNATPEEARDMERLIRDNP